MNNKQLLEYQEENGFTHLVHIWTSNVFTQKQIGEVVDKLLPDGFSINDINTTSVFDEDGSVSHCFYIYDEVGFSNGSLIIMKNILNTLQRVNQFRWAGVEDYQIRLIELQYHTANANGTELVEWHDTLYKNESLLEKEVVLSGGAI